MAGEKLAAGEKLDTLPSPNCFAPSGEKRLKLDIWCSLNEVFALKKRRKKYFNVCILQAEKYNILAIKIRGFRVVGALQESGSVVGECGVYCFFDEVSGGVSPIPQLSIYKNLSLLDLLGKNLSSGRLLFHGGLHCHAIKSINRKHSIN